MLTDFAVIMSSISSFSTCVFISTAVAYPEKEVRFSFFKQLRKRTSFFLINLLFVLKDSGKITLSSMAPLINM